jgi:nitronate monooxygenase
MRDLGPISPLAPAFPLAGGALAPLRAAAEAQGSGDFSPLWAGQAVASARETAQGLDATTLTQRLADDAHSWLRAQPAGVQ